ncbi:Switch-associated protein 70 [Oopsacas minuta]|uniref:Switch-associated protein 70 n=1 Tax=Oopsacas minuta TaxID=111878 RepID=A0AAV7K3E7_9METZ|nr:Switch-associated protein 70 [Oopsacas minuta]
MYGNQILCDRVYGSVTQTNCFKHLYKTLYDNRPKDNSSIPTLKGFLERYSDRFKVVFYENLSNNESHSFYHGLLKFDDFMDYICRIQDVSIEDCNISKHECWKIFYTANQQEIMKINKMNFPDTLLYQLWLIYCKLDVKGELKIARTIFNEFLEKLMEKSDLKINKICKNSSNQAHLNYPTFFSIIQEQCLGILPRDYGMVIVTEIYDTLFRGSLKQGYIYKMGKHMGSTRRWFMLTPDSLVYYDAKMRTNQNECKGTICISAYSNVRADDCSSKRDKFYFSLTCTRTKKRFNLFCDDATERQRWIKSINKAISAQAHQASIATLKRQDVEIGLEKWSFNYLLGLLDTLSPLEHTPTLDGASKWSSTRNLNCNEIIISQNREDTLRRKSLDWNRPDIFTKLSVPQSRGPPLVSPRPTLKSAPKRPPACKRHTGEYVEMNLNDNLTGYSSGYSSSTGSRSDEELDDFVATPRFPEKNTIHIDIKPLNPKSPKVMVRRNSGYVDMKIPSSSKDSLQKSNLEIEHPLVSIQETPLCEKRGKVQDLIKKYTTPITNVVPEALPRSLPSSPNPSARLLSMGETHSKDSYSSDITELASRSKTVHSVASTHPYRKHSTKKLILISPKILSQRDKVRSKSQNNLIMF